jgi:TPP-dependent pyruvate/acetoin dehydrogenase alpha subunit
VIVDGNDALAVYEATERWVAWARAGNGPVLIEAKTYRMRGHYVGDPQLYRPEGEVEAQRGRDPIVRLERTLLEAGVVGRDDVDRMRREADDEIEAAVRFGRESPLPSPEEALEDVYVTAPRIGGE